MTWNNPLWRAEGITDDKLNTRLRDNMLAIKNPAHDDILYSYSASDYESSGAIAWALIDASLELTIDTLGGDVLLLFRAKANAAFLTFYVDGSNVGGSDGICACPNLAGAGAGYSVMMIWPVQNLSRGSHTFGVYWKGGTLRTTVPPYFAAREVS